MEGELSLAHTKKMWHGTLKAYIIGFLGAIVLTAISFSLVVTKALPNDLLAYTIVSLALVQAVVQLIFFLHVGQEENPKWELLVFYFMLLVLFIVVAGTLWVMNDLNHRVMPSMAEVMRSD
jgi:cytochrome o ubiquinol oxidase operon protein cyoD